MAGITAIRRPVRRTSGFTGTLTILARSFEDIFEALKAPKVNGLCMTHTAKGVTVILGEESGHGTALTFEGTTSFDGAQDELMAVLSDRSEMDGLRASAESGMIVEKHRAQGR